MYALRRPVFAHIYEFFLQSVLVFLLFQPVKEKGPGLRFWLTAGVSLALMPLVRYNNAAAMLVWWGILETKHNVWQDVRRHRFALLAAGASAVLLAVFFVIPVLTHSHSGYMTKFDYFLRPWWLSQYPQRIANVIFGISWGLVWTAPFILIGTWAVVRHDFPLRSYLGWAMAAMLVNFHIIVTYSAQGGYYGYRYFIFSMIPLLVVPLAGWLRQGDERWGLKFRLLIIAIALFPLFSMLCFEGNNSTLTQHIVKLSSGYGFSNHTYQWEVWKLLFTQPVEWGIAVFKGGLLYWIYVAAHLTGMNGHLPDIVLAKYPSFRWDILVKVLIIYSLPFLLLYITSVISRNREGRVPAGR